MQQIETHKCFNGTLSVWEHKSTALKCTMRFSVFLPPQAKQNNVPFVTFLSGLTCTHDNFTTKAGAYTAASREGLAIIAPDTSPRGDDVPDDKDSYDFGQGAGFYVNATQEPWAQNYQMEHYIVEELNQVVCDTFPLERNKQGICGHSMGGHGALTLFLKHPQQYKSVSAFSPIVSPTQVPWGQKAFTGYLGENKEEWHKHDACSLMQNHQPQTNHNAEILIDQGAADSFLEEQLKPHLFQGACEKVGQNLILRLHDGYDHSYYFIQSFIEDHIKHHKRILK
ncbi:MAG: S-formylglutathione hydrolase [Alphaproteobacteria bacterium]